MTDHPRSAVPWVVVESAGPAGDVHRRPLPEPVEPSVWIHRVTTPALVLGSTQSLALVDRSAALEAGIEICRRRSGGGLVWLRPEEDLWVDVVLPRRSALWTDDVGAAFHWLGDAWARAIDDVWPTGQALTPPVSVTVHRGPAVGREAGRVICFAGLGAGEVSLDGHKVVGMSQRRTRSGARFQCALTWRWDPTPLAKLVSVDALAAAGIDLDQLAVGAPSRLLATGSPPDHTTMVDALLRRLPPP